MLLAIAGPIGAGKTTATEHLMNKWGAWRIREANVITKVAIALGMSPRDRSVLQGIANALEPAFGQAVFLRPLLDKHACGGRLCVVEGIRWIGAWEHMLERDPAAKMIFLEATPETRLLRSRMRGEKAGESQMDRYAFMSMDRDPTERYLSEFRKIARGQQAIVGNHGSLKETTRAIDELVCRWWPFLPCQA